MANTIPVDSSKITILAMSGARPMPARVELSDGSSRVDPNGAQATHRVTGKPIFQIDCVLPADPDDPKARMLTFAVKVACDERPTVTPGLPVRFIDLAVLTYSDQQTGRATLSWSATGVAASATSSKPAAFGKTENAAA